MNFDQGPPTKWHSRRHYAPVPSAVRFAMAAEIPVSSICSYQLTLTVTVLLCSNFGVLTSYSQKLDVTRSTSAVALIVKSRRLSATVLKQGCPRLSVLFALRQTASRNSDRSHTATPYAGNAREFNHCLNNAPRFRRNR